MELFIKVAGVTLAFVAVLLFVAFASGTILWLCWDTTYAVFIDPYLETELSHPSWWQWVVFCWFVAALAGLLRGTKSSSNDK